ncbi:ATP-binding protein [Clostridium cellulovorans]|uniref:YhaN AAA domain-containing protein n=1 Tax=Clostridium cellulovorans (strain ATCC 35296 / DSM 3052 / OCM 3 / 743B) TaxID=573061 RepID=D9SVI9_CLOC7|nr:AAA family ATPase [Clostridium cellulovorans]ADL51113.1 hypothetical protein Clocel_1360 [Clostridium cellulovorans 743B]
MIIKTLNIHSFGKLQDVMLNLEQGVNLIYGENEAGKSTVQKFIKAMFYGAKGKDREKVFPWNGKIPKGEISFILNGNEYILQRTFNASNAKDLIEVRDAITGEIKKEFNYRNLGYTVFNMGEGAFNKTAYISQVSSSYINGGEEEFTAKLTNLALSGEEDVSYEKAVIALDDRIKSIEGKNGFLLKFRGEEEILNRKLYEISQIEEETKDLSMQIMSLEIEKEKLKNDELKSANKSIESEEIEILKANLKKLEKFKDLTSEKILKYKKAYNYVQELRKRILEIKEIDYSILDLKESLKVQEELLGDLKAFKNVTEGYEDKLFYLNEEVSREIYSRESLDNKKELEVKYRKIKNKNNYQVGILVLFFLAIILITLLFKENRIYINSILIVLFIAMIIEFYKSSAEVKKIEKNIKTVEVKVKVSDNMKQLKVELEKYSCGDYKDFLKKLSLYKEHKMDLEIINSKIEEKELQLKKLDENRTKRELEQCENLIKDLLIDYEINDFQELEEMWQSYTTLNNEIIKREFQGKLIQKEESEENLRKTSVRLIELEKDILTLKNDNKELLQVLEGKLDTLERLEGIKQDIQVYEKKLHALKLARNVIEQSFSKIQKDFGPRLNNETETTVERITEGKYKEAMIDKSMDVVIRSDKDNGIRNIEDFSVGTKMQIYLSVRLSLLKLLYNNDIPIFFDEAFSYYDYDRLYNTLKYLKDEYKDKQLVIFACQNREKEILDRLESLYNYVVLGKEL